MRNFWQVPDAKTHAFSPKMDTNLPSVASPQPKGDQYATGDLRKNFNHGLHGWARMGKKSLVLSAFIRVIRGLFSA